MKLITLYDFYLFHNAVDKLIFLHDVTLEIYRYGKLKL